MFTIFFILYPVYRVTLAGITSQDVQFLNELPLDKLLRLKTSLQELVTTEYDNFTSTTPAYLNKFGAQAMAIKAPVKRTDYEEGLYKKESYSKVSHIFSMSVTTLAFLAFGGYLLCLIVQAIKSKNNYNPTPTPQPTTFVFSAGIKKRPQAQFSPYGRRRRDNRESKSLKQLNVPPEQLFSALLHLCEGYARWSEHEIYMDIK